MTTESFGKALRVQLAKNWEDKGGARGLLGLYGCERGHLSPDVGSRPLGGSCIHAAAAYSTVAVACLPGSGFAESSSPSSALKRIFPRTVAAVSRSTK